MASVKNIAVVGASGRVGGEILKSLLDCGTFNVTAVSRQESTATFKPNVAVKKADYASVESLESVFKGQEVVIITLQGRCPPEIQSNMIKAAANVGVPWVLPNEYGQDLSNEKLIEGVEILAHKKVYRDEIEKLGRSSWIGICSNLWYDFSLGFGSYGIKIADRKAEIYDDGNTSITTTTVPQVGRAVAKLLSLPIDSKDSPCLSDYKNKYIYVKSFDVTQNQMLASVQRATGTTDADWTITHVALDEWMQQGWEKLKSGNFMGFINVMYGRTFTKGLGDQFHGREVANEKLGLEEEDLDEVTKRVVDMIKAKYQKPAAG
ncbi:hypothetical protein MMC25_006714 [Agyrium rufum]|nr:hypothetical protein [Agyrium rufum]